MLNLTKNITTYLEQLDELKTKEERDNYTKEFQKYHWLTDAEMIAFLWLATNAIKPTEKPFRSQTLTCWCCGQRFKTRPKYKDQDQDEGFGICKPCQKKDNKQNKTQYEEMFQQIYDAMKPANKAIVDEKIKTQWPVYKTILVNIGLEKGRFKRTIGGK